MCQRQKLNLTEHHVVEAPDESGEVTRIFLCNECHVLHERYRNYLKDICGVDIDNAKKFQDENS